MSERNHNQKPTARELIRFALNLRHTFDSTPAGYQHAKEWLYSPKRYLETIYKRRLAPADAIKIGGLRYAISTLEALHSGVFI